MYSNECAASTMMVGIIVTGIIIGYPPPLPAHVFVCACVSCVLNCSTSALSARYLPPRLPYCARCHTICNVQREVKLAVRLAYCMCENTRVAKVGTCSPLKDLKTAL